MTTRMVASNMELHALSTGREPRVATVTRVLRQTLFRCGGGTRMRRLRGELADQRWDRRKGRAEKCREAGRNWP